MRDPNKKFWEQNEDELEPYTEADYIRVLLLDRPESGFESLVLGNENKLSISFSLFSV